MFPRPFLHLQIAVCWLVPVKACCALHLRSCSEDLRCFHIICWTCEQQRVNGVESPHVIFRNRPVELRGCLGDCHLGKGYTYLGKLSIWVSVISLMRNLFVTPVLY